MIYTTLNEIKSFRPCARGWQQLLRGLGKSEADDELFPLARVIDTNNLDDAIWCLRVSKASRQVAVDFSRWCAESSAAAADYATKAAAYAADAVYAAAYAADAADASAAYAASYAASAADTLTLQKEKLRELLTACVQNPPL